MGRTVQETEVGPRIAEHLGELFSLEMKETSKKDLLQKLEHIEESVTVSA